MRARPTYTDTQLRRFVALARGGRDNRADVLDAMRRHPAEVARQQLTPAEPDQTEKAA